MADMNQAHSLYSAQLDTYHRLANDTRVNSAWCSPKMTWERCWRHGKKDEKTANLNNDHPVGLVVLMEGAEGVRRPGELEEGGSAACVFIGPAWMGNRFCGARRQPGPLTGEGFALWRRWRISVFNP